MTPRQPRRTVPACSSCGWASHPITKAEAREALARHSCTKHRTQLERAARGRTRWAAVDRSPKPCPHRNPAHQHGRRVTYFADRCRCEPCAAANSAYERQRIRSHAYGRFDGLVDAGDVRAHVERLRSCGLGIRRIAEIAGVPRSTVTKLLYGKRNRLPSRRVSADTARRIQGVADLAVTQLAAHALVDSCGSRRRLQALATLGWSTAALARRAGINRQRLDRALTRDRTTAATAMAVTMLYDALWSISAPPSAAATRTLRTARDYGWVPPLAWDDDEIDLPDTHPHRPADTARDVEKYDLVEAWTMSGASTRTIAERLTCATRTVTRMRRRIRSSTAASEQTISKRAIDAEPSRTTAVSAARSA